MYSRVQGPVTAQLAIHLRTSTLSTKVLRFVDFKYSLPCDRPDCELRAIIIAVRSSDTTDEALIEEIRGSTVGCGGMSRWTRISLAAAIADGLHFGANSCDDVATEIRPTGDPPWQAGFLFAAYNTPVFIFMEISRRWTMLLPAEASPAVGAGMLLALGYSIYWVVRSRRRIRTILYALASVVVEFGVAWLFGCLLPLYTEEQLSP